MTRPTDGQTTVEVWSNAQQSLVDFAAESDEQTAESDEQTAESDELPEEAARLVEKMEAA